MAVTDRRIDGGAGIVRGVENPGAAVKCRLIDRRFCRECEGVLPSFIRHRDAMSSSQARDGRSLEVKFVEARISGNGMWARAVETPNRRCQRRKMHR